MVRNSHENLVSRRFSIDVGKGFIVIFMRFVLFCREFMDLSIPFSFYVVKGPVDFSFGLSLFSGIVFLLHLSLVFCDLAVGGRRGGGRGERGGGFSGFESSLVWDTNRERWWGW